MNPDIPSGLSLFVRMDFTSQNAVALAVAEGAGLRVASLLNMVNDTDFIDEGFFAQMAGYRPSLEPTQVRHLR